MDRTDEILAELRSLTAVHHDLHVKLAAFEAAQAQICKAASCQRDEHHRALFGNGKPGLVSIAQDLVGRVSRLEASPAPAKKPPVIIHQHGVTRKEIAAWCTGIGAAIVALCKALGLIPQ